VFGIWWNTSGFQQQPPRQMPQSGSCDTFTK
jgi:hypothetical protein